MRLEFTVPFRRVLTPRILLTATAPVPQGHPPRIARLVALAHKLDGLVRSDAVKDYGELARLGHISPARLSQIMVLLQLAPQIQEYVLFLSAGDARLISEMTLRKIAREPRWDCQHKLFDELLKK
jgi:hypothetical protein